MLDGDCRGGRGVTTSSSAAFLAGRDGRTWESDRIDRPATYHIGAGPSQLEVTERGDPHTRLGPN